MVQSSNFTPIIAGIVVDIVHGVDAVEIVPAQVQVTADIPYLPRTIADITEGGAGAGPGDVGNFTRVSNKEVSILRRALEREKSKLGKGRLNKR